MTVKREYYNIRGSVINMNQTRDCFMQLIGEHAARFVDFVTADRQGDKRVLMSTWVRISELNKSWLRLMCPIYHEQFSPVCNKLINNYAEVIGDYILDANTIHSETSRKKVEDIGQLEGEFYAELVPQSKQEATRKQWQQYTHSIGVMIKYHDVYGNESESFYDAAAACIHTGKMLGIWLDSVI
jgi:hypothetical protein